MQTSILSKEFQKIGGFLNGLNDKVKLYGCTINTCGLKNCSHTNEFTHIQSYAFSTDREGLKILIDNNFIVYVESSPYRIYSDIMYKNEDNLIVL